MTLVRSNSRRQQSENSRDRRAHCPNEYTQSGIAATHAISIRFLCFVPLQSFSYISSRVILAYLVSAYGKDESLYPKDFRSRAMVDQRLHFDLGTLYQRVVDYYVSRSDLPRGQRLAY